MRIRANFLVAGLILCAGLAHGQNPPEKHNGYWWAKQPRPTKLAFVVGFHDGSEIVRNNIITACLVQNGVGLEQIKQLLPGQPSYEAASADCDKKHNLLLNVLKPPTSTYGQVVDGLDQFYADYRNENIDFGLAIYYVFGELDGHPQNLLDEDVRSWRHDATP
jgi:hypothetical protein